MKKSIKTNKKEGTVSITVTIPKRRLATDSVTVIRTRDVIKMLKEEGFSFKNECVKECTVTDEKEDGQHKGTWVFSLHVEHNKPKIHKKPHIPKVKPKKALKTVVSAAEESSEVPVFTKKSSYTSKTLDKSVTK
jgi:hypothetical protein